MTDLFFAYSGYPPAGEAMCAMAPGSINILVSFYYFEDFKKRIGTRAVAKKWTLDSGAFSAWKSKKTIDMEALIKETKNPFWDDAVGLDVIGDAVGSLKNALYMQKQGSPAMPVFHIGDPWEILDEYCAKFDKVGLSCRFGEPVNQSMKFYEQCFARHWPHKYHSFGWVAENMLLAYPFHTADTASWVVAPAAFGTWKRFGHISARGDIDLRSEIEEYLKMERKVQHRWKPTFQQLGWNQPQTPPLPPKGPYCRPDYPTANRNPLPLPKR